MVYTLYLSYFQMFVYIHICALGAKSMIDYCFRVVQIGSLQLFRPLNQRNVRYCAPDTQYLTFRGLRADYSRKETYCALQAQKVHFALLVIIQVLFMVVLSTYFGGLAPKVLFCLKPPNCWFREIRSTQCSQQQSC